MAAADKNAIYERLASAPTFHPNTAELFTDWNLQAGDVVSIREGEDTYRAPLYNMRMTWTGAPTVEVSSSGNTKREPLPALTRRDYGYSSGIAANKKEIEEIEGTELYVNRDSIVAVSGKFTVDGDVVKLIDGALFQVKKNGVYSTVGTVTEIAAVDGKIETEKGRINTIVGTGLYQHRDHIDLIAGKFTFDDTTGNVKLDSGAHLQVLKDGVYSTVGTVTEIDAVGERVSVVEGTAAIQHSDSIWNVAGKFSVDSNNNVHVINGSALYVGEGSSSLAVYKEGDITAGFIVSQINGGTALIQGNHINLSANTSFTSIVTKTGINSLADGETLYGLIGDIEGTAVLQNSAYIWNIAGRFSVDANGNVHVKSGTALYLGENEASLALYKDGDITAGFLVGIINGDSTAKITADHVLISANKTLTTLVGTYTGDLDDFDDRLIDVEGTAVIQNSAAIWTVAGKFTVDANDNVHIIDGSGLYIDQGQTSLGVWNEGNLTAGVMIKKINGGASGDSEAVIKASKINLEGYVTAISLTTTFFHDKIADISLLNVAAIAATASAQNSYCYLNEFKGNYYKVNISGGGGSTTTNDLCDGVYDLQIVQDGNTYKLQRRTIKSSTWVDVGSFSRATTLTGSWGSGNNDNKYTVTASPQGNSTFDTVFIGPEGAGSSDNFSVCAYHTSATSANKIASLTKNVYLTEDVTNKLVKAHWGSATGTAYAQVSTQDTYDAGYEVTKNDIQFYRDGDMGTTTQNIPQGAVALTSQNFGIPDNDYGYFMFHITCHGTTKYYYFPFDTR